MSETREGENDCLLSDPIIDSSALNQPDINNAKNLTNLNRI